MTDSSDLNRLIVKGLSPFKRLVPSVLTLFLLMGVLSAYDVAPVVKNNQEHAEACSDINKMMQAYWKEQGVEPRPVAKDEVFLRRAYLDIIGRVPTRLEVEAFLHSEDSKKRSKLIDKLMDSDGYVSHQFNFWADLLRVQTYDRKQGGDYFAQWIKEVVAGNKPYDEFVREMLTADGLPWENPAVGYYMRDTGMPLDNMSNTTRVFLGTRMECAQCHNDPFDKWTQKDFYEFAAFRMPVNTRGGANSMPEMVQLKKAFKQNGMEKDTQREMNKLLQDFGYAVSFNEKKELRYPKDYQYDDAKPNDVAQASFIFGDDNDVAALKGHLRVDAFVDWMVSPENDRFAKVIANRLWKKVVGAGLIEPVDYMKDDTISANPELTDYLTELMVAQGFDMKQFMRVLYNSDLYQRAAADQDVMNLADFQFTGPILKRMSAQQLWDSYMALLIDDIDYLQVDATERRYGSKAKFSAPLFHEYMKKHTVDETMAFLEKYVAMELQIKEVARKKLYARNENKGRELFAKLDKQQKEMRQQQLDFFQKEVVNVQEPVDKKSKPTYSLRLDGMKKEISKDKDMSKQEKQREINRLNARAGHIRAAFAGGGKPMRSSDMPQPMKPGHFLSEFGQSDRELVDNQTAEANMGQVLTLMNSRLVNGALVKGAIPVWESMEEDDVERKLDMLYLGFLSRYPNEVEKEKLIPLLADKGEAGQDRLVWSILNSKQFMFVQ